MSGSEATNQVPISSSRKSVPKNVERTLWAESMGYCMRPKCDTRLIDEGVNIAEQAHIVEHADDGPVSADNLILLCRVCHKKVDHNRDESTVPKLRRWKKRRNQRIRREMAKRCQSYDDLVEAVVPLLADNARIFGIYGPDANLDNAGANATHSLWKAHEPEILANNEQLALIFEANESYFHRENWETIEEFIVHAREFAMTRSGELPRKALFPRDLPAMFNLTSSAGGTPPNVSALQNLIRQLQDDDSFIALELQPKPQIHYMKNDEFCSFDLSNRPLMQQVYWSRRCFQPETTLLRLDDLLFLLNWLTRTGIAFRYPDPADLTSLIVADEIGLKLFYEYALTIENLYDIDSDTHPIVVNLFEWNGGKITADASEYAAEIGITALLKKEFFRYAHRKLK